MTGPARIAALAKMIFVCSKIKSARRGLYSKGRAAVKWPGPIARLRCGANHANHSANN